MFRVFFFQTFKHEVNRVLEILVVLAGFRRIYHLKQRREVLHVSPEALSGKSGADVVEGLAKMAAIPLMTVIQCALNRDMLRESEKHAEHPLYWAFDTKELLKGDMKTRFDAYKVALESNFMQIDEVRYQEDLAPLGLSWIRLGLQDVLYDPKTKRIYTPNTGQVSVMGEQTLNPPQEPPTK